MASLWKREESRYWTACFTASDGRQLKRSTKSTDRRTAQKLADAMEEAYAARRTSSQVRRIMAGIHTELTGEALPETSMNQFTATWLKNKEAERCAESTMLFYKHGTARFLKFLGPVADGPLADVTRRHVEEFRNELSGTRAPKTVTHQIKCLRMLFKAARSEGLITENPAEFVTLKLRKTGERKEAFTIPQLARLLETCDAEWKSMVLFGALTGQRLGDLAALRWNQIDLSRNELRLTTQKTGKSLIIPFAPELQNHILSLPTSDDPAAFVHPRAANLKKNTLSGQFADLLIASGLRTKDSAGKERNHNGLSFHSLRHTAVTLLKEAGIPDAVVMALVGHDSAQMSAHYSHVGTEALGAAAKAFPTLRAEQASDS